MDRDVELRALGKRIKRLDVADDGLCFGRLDSLVGERTYIGRIGLLDENNEYEPYCSIGGRRQRGPSTRLPRPTPRTCFGVGSSTPADDASSISPTNSSAVRTSRSRRASGDSSDIVLLAAVNAPRGDGMRDIVATIQAEQDEIIRLDHSGVLVIEGGPGTGKTVVALHRVAYCSTPCGSGWNATVCW